jgi:hypothetical protein
VGALVVDRGARTVAGFAVPYGVVARSSGRLCRFGPGWWRTDGRVRLLRDHDNAQRLGAIRPLLDLPSGLFAVARVLPGRAGDRALAEADAGLLGFSVGVPEVELRPDPDDPRVRLVVTGLLVEMSLTADPVFGR